MDTYSVIVFESFCNNSSRNTVKVKLLKKFIKCYYDYIWPSEEELFSLYRYIQKENDIELKEAMIDIYEYYSTN